MSGPMSTRALVFGSLMAGLTVVLSALAHIPIISAVLFFTLGLPTALVLIRYNWRPALLSAAVGTLVTGMLMGPLAGITQAALAALPGLVLGQAIKIRAGAAQAVLMVMAVLALSLLVVFFLLPLMMGMNVMELMLQSVEQALEETSRRAPPETRESLELLAENLRQVTNLLLPALVVITGAMLAGGKYLAARLLLPRLGHHVEPVPPFAAWRFPLWCSWTLLGALGLVAITSMDRVPELPTIFQTMVINVYMILMALMTVQGLSVVYWFLRIRQDLNKGVAAGLTVLAYMLLGRGNFPILLFLGVWDAFMNFRRLGLETADQSGTEGGDKR